MQTYIINIILSIEKLNLKFKFSDNNLYKKIKTYKTQIQKKKKMIRSVDM